MEFQKALERHFKFTGRAARDNLPVLAIHRRKWGPSGDNGRHCLARVVCDLDCRRGVEIGTNWGDSAKIWLTCAPKLHLLCIDPYATYNARHSQEEQDAIYTEATKRLKPYNAEIIRESSLVVVERVEDKSLDFVYIDGNHAFDSVMQDLIRWVPKVRRGGLVMLHDYCHHWWAGVIRAVDAYTMAHRVEPWFLTRDYRPTAFWEKRAERAS